MLGMSIEKWTSCGVYWIMSLVRVWYPSLLDNHNIKRCLSL